MDQSGAPVTASDPEETRPELLLSFWACVTTRRRQVAEKSIAMASTGENTPEIKFPSRIRDFIEVGRRREAFGRRILQISDTDGLTDVDRK